MRSNTLRVSIGCYLIAEIGVNGSVKATKWSNWTTTGSAKLEASEIPFSNPGLELPPSECPWKNWVINKMTLPNEDRPCQTGLQWSFSWPMLLWSRVGFPSPFWFPDVFPCGTGSWSMKWGLKNWALRRSSRTTSQNKFGGIHPKLRANRNLYSNVKWDGLKSMIRLYKPFLRGLPSWPLQNYKGNSNRDLWYITIFGSSSINPQGFWTKTRLQGDAFAAELGSAKFQRHGLRPTESGGYSTKCS